MQKNVLNRVRLSGNQNRIDELLEAVRYDGCKPGTLDFEKLLPIPQNITRDSERLYWSEDNWGSKWNSYGWGKLQDNTLSFFSANSRVMPVITALAERYPEVGIRYCWSSDTLGEHVGYAEFSSGVMTEERKLDDGSEEAFALASELWKTEFSGMDTQESDIQIMA